MKKADDVLSTPPKDIRYLRNRTCAWCDTPLLERRCLSISPPRCSETDMKARRKKCLDARRGF